MDKMEGSRAAGSPVEDGDNECVVAAVCIVCSRPADLKAQVEVYKY